MDYPSMLSYTRSISPSHFLMFSAPRLDATRDTFAPVVVRAEPLRGLNATAKSLAEGKETEAVLQVVESAALERGHSWLVLSGRVGFQARSRRPHQCNEPALLERHQALWDAAVDAGHMLTLARRYALNLASGLWAWRNAEEAANLHVRVTHRPAGAAAETLAFDNLLPVEGKEVFNFELPEYAPHRAALERLGELIASGLSSRGRRQLLVLEVQAFLDVGAAARVYPSQEWASETTKANTKREWGGSDSSGVTRFLAKLRTENDELQGIINDRKVGNQLRQIDTWHGDDAFGAIAVELYGANSHHGYALRSAAGKSLFAVTEKVVKGESLAEAEQLYYLACCVRGNVSGRKE